MPQPSSNLIGQNLNTTTYSGTPQINVSSNPYGTQGLVSNPKISSTNIPIPGSLSSQGGIQGSAGATGLVPAPKISPLVSTSPTTSSIDYTLHPGETIDAYNARIAASRQAPLSPSMIPGQAQGGLSQAQIDAGNAAANQTTPPASVPQPNPQNSPYTNTGAPGFSPTVGALANIAAGPTPEYVAAQNQYLEANKGLAQLKADAAQQATNIGGSRTNLSEAGGEQGLLQNLVSGKESALTGEMTAAQAAAQTATGQQGTQQQGLTAAGGLSAPVPANMFGFFNPAQGTYNQYGGVQGGGAATAGGVQAQFQQGGAVQTMLGQQAQAKTLATNLGTLIDQAGINPASGAGALNSFANGVNQWLEKNTGDPQYQNAANLINEIASRYASILNQSGGTPTDQSTISHSIINGLASGQDIKTVLGQLDKNATDSISALKGAATGTGSQGGSTVPGSTYGLGGNFVQQSDGSWKYVQ